MTQIVRQRTGYMQRTARRASGSQDMIYDDMMDYINVRPKADVWPA